MIPAIPSSTCPFPSSPPPFYTFFSHTMATDKGSKASKKSDKKADKKVDKKSVEKKVQKEAPAKAAPASPAKKTSVPVSSKEILAKANAKA